MPVRFFVESDPAAYLAVSHPQGAALLAALGEEPPDGPRRPGPVDGPFRGALRPAAVAARLAAVRRQLACGRVREFTSRDLDADGLLRALAAVEALAERAARADAAVAFQEAGDE